MTHFRPCIDLHEGRVKQIVGSSLRDAGPGPQTHFVSERDAAHYAEIYRREGLEGGHVIMLGPGNQDAAGSAIAAWPHGLQIGGGLDPDSAAAWLEAGAEKVIVTSWVFSDGQLDMARVEAMSRKVGKQQLVIDLSCRRVEDGWRVATDRWQTLTRTDLDPSTLEVLAEYCSEYLVHAADLEGRQGGIDRDLVGLLGRASPIPCTYAGGAREIADLERVETLSDGRVDLTFGSALDIFGGDGVRLEECVAWNRRR